MAKREDLLDWVQEAVLAIGKNATRVQVAKHIWSNHVTELRESGDLFFTWQYDMRWAAERLRRSGEIPENAVTPQGVRVSRVTGFA